MKNVSKKQSYSLREAERHLPLVKDRLSRLVPYQDLQPLHWFIVAEEVPVGADVTGSFSVDLPVTIILHMEDVRNHCDD